MSRCEEPCAYASHSISRSRGLSRAIARPRSVRAVSRSGVVGTAGQFRESIPVGKRHQRGAAAAAVAIAREVRGDVKQLVAPVRLALVPGARSQKTEVGFLQQVVGEVRIAGDPGQIGPQRASGAVVEAAEGIFVHLENSSRCGVVRAELVDGGEGHVTHGRREPDRAARVS